MQVQKLENDLSLKSNAVEQLQHYLTEAQQTKEKYEKLKDENIDLITKLEGSMNNAMQLETQLKQAESGYQTKITTIETELQKYMMSKQQENQQLLL